MDVPRTALLVTFLCFPFAAPALGADQLWTRAGTEPVRAVALSSDGKVVAVASDYLHISEWSGGLVASSRRERRGNRFLRNLVVSGTDSTVSAFCRDGSKRGRGRM